MAQHIFERVDMLTYLRSLKTSQKVRYKRMKDMYGYRMKKMKIELNKKNLTKKEIRMINEKIRRKLIRERIIRNVTAGIITLIVFFFLLRFLNTRYNLL